MELAKHASQTALVSGKHGSFKEGRYYRSVNLLKTPDGASLSVGSIAKVPVI